MKAFALILLAAAVAFPADPPQAVVDAGAGAGPRFANRILLHPVTSFSINGVNGRYERRVFNGRLGLGAPFYLGRHSIAGVRAATTWGGGGALSWYRTSRPSSARLTASAEWLDMRRVDRLWWDTDRDPTFPSYTGDSEDVYHVYRTTATLLMGYRWEYPTRRFAADFDIGVAWSRTAGPWADEDDGFGGGTRYDFGEYHLLRDGFYPVTHFSVGFPF